MPNVLFTQDVLPAELTHRFKKTDPRKPLPGIKVNAVRAEHASFWFSKILQPNNSDRTLSAIP